MSGFLIDDVSINSLIAMLNILVKFIDAYLEDRTLDVTANELRKVRNDVIKSIGVLESR